MSDVPSWLVEGATVVAHRNVDGHNTQQQGIVRYVGLIDGMKGTFVGIELPNAGQSLVFSLRFGYSKRKFFSQFNCDFRGKEQRFGGGKAILRSSRR